MKHCVAVWEMDESTYSVDKRGIIMLDLGSMCVYMKGSAWPDYENSISYFKNVSGDGNPCIIACCSCMCYESLIVRFFSTNV